MASRLWVPTTLTLLAALILSFLVSISLPFLLAMDISRITSKGAVFGAKDMRLGIWTACAWSVDNKRTCLPTGHGYNFPVGTLKDDLKIVTITAAWTRGLAVHPVATGFIAVAFAASLSTRHTVNLFAPLLCYLAALVTLIAFAIDIALHLHVRVLVGSLKTGANISAGPGFWITLVVLVLCLAVGSLLLAQRRREASGDAAYPMLSSQSTGGGLFSRFRRK